MTAIPENLSEGGYILDKIVFRRITEDIEVEGIEQEC
jgi:hypothetical protein